RQRAPPDRARLLQAAGEASAVVAPQPHADDGSGLDQVRVAVAIDIAEGRGDAAGGQQGARRAVAEAVAVPHGRGAHVPHALDDVGVSIAIDVAYRQVQRCTFADV